MEQVKKHYLLTRVSFAQRMNKIIKLKRHLIQKSISFFECFENQNYSLKIPMQGIGLGRFKKNNFPSNFQIVNFFANSDIVLVYSIKFCSDFKVLVFINII